VFGRSGMGETVAEGLFSDRWRIRRDDMLIYAESIRLDGAIADKLATSAATNGGVAIATIVLTPADEATILPLRTLAFRGEVGVSAWNGLAVLRFVAQDGAALRHDLVAALTTLRGRALPRLWLN
jgi:urease accessory protein